MNVTSMPSPHTPSVMILVKYVQQTLLSHHGSSSQLCCALITHCQCVVASLCLTQGYTSSSSTANSGTMFRSFARNASVASRLIAQRRKEQQLQPLKSLEQLMAQLEVRNRVVSAA